MHVSKSNMNFQTLRKWLTILQNSRPVLSTLDSAVWMLTSLAAVLRRHEEGSFDESDVPACRRWLYALTVRSLV